MTPTSLPSPCYVFSDAHIGAAGGGGEGAGPRNGSDVELRVLQFLESLSGRAGSVVINGDLFDFWFEWRHVLPRAGYRVVAALSALVRSGVSVLWIAGNHDCWGAEIVRDAGIHYMEGAWRGTLAGWKAHVEHGDGLRTEDRGYRALRRILRNRWAVRAFRILHPDWGTALARGSAHASRTYRAPDEGAGLRNVALRLLEEDSALELVVFGHSHVATLERRGTSHGIYANAGEWLLDPTYLRIEADRIELLRWSLEGSVTLHEEVRRLSVRT